MSNSVNYEFRVKVSIIIPVYNAEMYIRETLKSVVEQTISEIEIIIVNDGSTDNSQKIIDEYCKNDKRIISLVQKNLGPGSARNNGIINSTGEYICFVDSDDLLPKNSIEIRYNLAKSKDVDVVVGGTTKFNENKKWEQTNHTFDNGYKNILSFPELYLTLGPCNKLFKSALIKDIKFPTHIKYAEDHVFINEVFYKAGKSIYTTDESVYFYRHSQEENKLSNQYVDSLSTLEQIIKSLYLTLKNIDNLFKNKYEKIKLKTDYLNRLLKYDIWPTLKNIISSRNIQTQIGSFNCLQSMIDEIESDVLSNCIELQIMCTKRMVDRYLSIRGLARKEYIKMLNLLLNKVNSAKLAELEAVQGNFVKYIMKASNKNTDLYIYQYLTKRYIKKKFINGVNNFLIKKIWFGFSKIFPINKNKVIIATNKETLDSNLYLICKAIGEKCKKIDLKIFLHKDLAITEKMGRYFDLATAGFIIIGDYYNPIYAKKFKKEVSVIQTWHACGAFKKFGHGAIDKNESNTVEFENKAHGQYTNVLVSGKEVSTYYSEAFKTDISKVLPIGIPRTDKFFDLEYKEYIKEVLLNMYPVLKNKKIITYAPTFRGGPGKRKNFNLKMDIKKMCQKLGDEYVLILKFHPSVEFVDLKSVCNEFVIDLTSYCDINDILIITDILITDYSSVVFEYSLLERPMLFYAYDLESYLDERDFYYDYKEFVPGKIVKTTDELIRNIKTNDFQVEKVSVFKNKFFDYFDGKSTERFVYKFFKNT